MCAQDVKNESMAAKYRASSHKGLLGTLESSDVRSSGHSSREMAGCQRRSMERLNGASPSALYTLPVSDGSSSS